MKKLISFVGSALVFASGFSAQAACNIYNSTVPGQIILKIDGQNYTSMRDLLLALQADPSILSLVQSPTGSIKPKVFVSAAVCSPYTGSGCWATLAPKYVSPATRTVVNGVTEYTIEDIDAQYRRDPSATPPGFGIADGIDTPAALATTMDHYWDLYKIEKLLPSCQASATTSSSDDPQLGVPTAPAPVVTQNPTPTSGGYQLINSATGSH